MSLTPQEILEQSKNAFAQWEDKWRKYCTINGEKYKADGNKFQDLAGIGAGRKLVCCAMGASLEDKIELIKKYREDGDFDVMCVDKCFGYLVERGIIPDYVIIADAGIDYEKWLKPYHEHTVNSILIANVCANPAWTTNWRGQVFYHVNKDNIQSEKLFSELSGCHEIIPAASNVGNGLVVFATHVMNYDKYLLVGYDYAWGPDDNYYAFNDSDKRYWMHHMNIVDNNGRLTYTSNNLYFSCRWLFDYIQKMCIPNNVKVVNCCDKGILFIERNNFERELKNSKKRVLSDKEKEMLMTMKTRTEKVFNDATGLNKLLRENAIGEIIVKYVTPCDLEYVMNV